MRFIVKDIHSNSCYLIDTNPNALIGPRPTAIRGPDTINNLERYLKITNYYDFYYIPAYRGEPQRRLHTQHYKTVFPPGYIDPTPYNGIASGWWSRALKTTAPTNNADDFDRFHLCAQAS